MSKVTVENPCGCFFKSGLPEEQSFNDRASAKEEAESLRLHMEKHFCKKHTFSVLPSGTSYKVVISPRS